MGRREVVGCYAGKAMAKDPAAKYSEKKGGGGTQVKCRRCRRFVPADHTGLPAWHTPPDSGRTCRK